MKIWHAPVGKLVSGHVLDVNRKPFERALRDLDPHLYVRWNSKKLRGWGCYEIRRKPSQKTAIYQGSHAGVNYMKVQYVEFNDIHHVIDAAFLNYDVIRKLKEMDTWTNKNWVADFEKGEEDYRDARQAKALDHLKDVIRDNRSAMRDLMHMVQSGVSLDSIVQSTNWA